jgi:hypothetical protein
MDYSETKRRSLSESLGTNPLSAEADAFLRGGNTPPARESPEPAAPVAAPAVAATVARTPAVACPLALAQPRPATSPMVSQAPVPTGGLVSVTVRLPTALAETLLRVSLERRLRKERPFAQQDIVAEAVRDWIEAQGEAEAERRVAA